MRVLRRRSRSHTSFTLHILLILALAMCAASLKLSIIQQDQTHSTHDEQEDLVQESIFNSFLSQLSSSSSTNDSTTLRPAAGDRNDLESVALKISDFLQHKSVLVVLGSTITVIGCCLVSQCVVRISKNYRLQLNRYYQKKRYEKAKLIQQYLNDLEEEGERKRQKRQGS